MSAHHKLPRRADDGSREKPDREGLVRTSARFSLVDPRAVAVKIEAQHMCMMMRGVKKQQSLTRTECVIGTDSLNPLEQERLLNQIDV